MTDRLIDHVTGIARKEKALSTFFVDSLGLREFPRKSSRDDLATELLSFGFRSDSKACLFFLLYPRAQKQIRGQASIHALSFAIAKGSALAWRERCKKYLSSSVSRFEQPTLILDGPDDLRVELVESEIAGLDDASLRFLLGVTVRQTKEKLEFWKRLLPTEATVEENRHRFGLAHQYLDFVLAEPADDYAELGAGAYHHLALHSERLELPQSGLSPSFGGSHYFHMSDGVLLEFIGSS